MDSYVCIKKSDSFEEGEIVSVLCLNTGVGDYFYTIYKSPFLISKIMLRNEFNESFIEITKYRDNKIEQILDV